MLRGSIGWSLRPIVLEKQGRFGVGGGGGRGERGRGNIWSCLSAILYLSFYFSLFIVCSSTSLILSLVLSAETAVIQFMFSLDGITYLIRLIISRFR